MSLWEKVFAACMVIFGAGVLFCVVAWWWTDRRGPSAGEREAVQDAPGVHYACCYCATPEGEEHDVWCSRRPVVGPPGPPIVPGRPEVQWDADLDRFYADYDTYRTELRLPGERAS